MTEVSPTRLYLGNLPRNATKSDVEAHFNTHGTGKITEIKLMNGFGFIEYEDAMDARDVVPAFHGSDFMGERLTVQFARGSRHREVFANTDQRTVPRPRRTPFRMQISGLPGETSWQDLKDFARQSGEDVVYSETGRDRDGKGSFVEFETAADLRTAVEKLDGREFKGARVTCVADNVLPPIVTAHAHPLLAVEGTLLRKMDTKLAGDDPILRLAMAIVTVHLGEIIMTLADTVRHLLAGAARRTTHARAAIPRSPMPGAIGMKRSRTRTGTVLDRMVRPPHGVLRLQEGATMSTIVRDTGDYFRSCKWSPRGVSGAQCSLPQQTILPCRHSPKMSWLWRLSYGWHVSETAVS
ncbi:MAG: hypothetical protein M1833_001274 [Piccolia ochrophora]|nr:MAG: hypothetical protein M1833_001274 [Piccolia ochrophora]